ncbi:type VII secretion protein EccCa [Pseudonocardia humida]|uniref:Type VII secretion protein EccCa n=1 Tax=Pseudonocardia humida TaxID=2800819 RepID=A0ABT1A5Y0_9PSEU|nr:type VII secretion protein EccCa [Pseudonocardia humida]MCO1658385.1 type VII secretion protein EccCa [Pseudonocardia humida]
MTTRLVHRPARRVPPLTAEDPVAMSPPPLLPDGRTGSGLQSLIPLAGAGLAMSMMMFLRGSGFAALGAVILVVSLTAAGVLYITQRGQASRKRRAQRELYVTYLEELRDDLREREREFRERSVRLDPPAGHLLGLAADPARLWERRRGDVDFLRLRVGTGALPVREITMREEGTVVSPTDPFMRSEARALIRRFERVPGMPLRMGLDRAGDVSVIAADRADVLRVARTLIAQLAALHAPDDVRLAVIAPPEAESDWGWTRWLPHLLDREQIGPAGPVPRLVPDEATLVQVLAADLRERARTAATAHRHGGGSAEARTRPRLVVIDDAFGRVARRIPTPDPAIGLPALGITVVHLLADRLQEPSEVSRRLVVTGRADSGGGVEATLTDLAATPPVVISGDLDEAPQPLLEGLARRLAPLRLSADSYDDGTGTPPADLADLLGLPDPAVLDVARLWRPRSERDFLRVPIGLDSAGRPLLLDLKESAQLGMGPHGLCVGATGSGKSELLRTLVLALAAVHPPEDLSMVLVDYKGGAAFAPFGSLPHVAGLITNLSGDAAMVERMYTSLDGEVLRRQQLLADAGRITDITDYRLRRAERGAPPEMPALPHLLVVIDEFGELLTAKPEFAELFLRLGRIGRSIGVHLLLSSQRIEQGKLRGLETYLSYRIGLRTLSDMESRTVLDTPDAARLPALPGNGYLKVDVTVYEKFKAAYVSGPLADSVDAELAPVAGPPVKPMLRFGRVFDDVADAEPAQPTRRGSGPTLMSTVVGKLADAAAPVAPIWLPPLPEAVTLDRATGGFDVTADGVRLRAGGGDGLKVPLGLLDDPARQWQGPWLVDLAAGGGHLAVLGGPGSGKSTALRTLALGVAATTTPTQVGIYGIDLLGSGLRGLSGLPHVGGVAGRDDRERVRRTVDEVHAMLARREQIFARNGLDTLADLRAGRAAGRHSELGSDEVVLLVDGYGQLTAEFEELESAIHDVLARGGRFGVHVVATVRRWSEVRGAQQVAFTQRVELRLTEPAESGIDGKLARGVPADAPGRGLTTGKLYAQVALPRLDGLPDPVSSGLAEAVTLIKGSWTGALPAQVRVLPAVLPASDLADVELKAGSVPLGRFENDFSPAVLELVGRDQHLLVLGDTGTGKTNLLRAAVASLVRGYTPEELVFAVVDPRHGLAGAVPEEYLGGYAHNSVLAQRLASAVAGQLAERTGGDEVASTGPPTGGMAAGLPRIVLLVDDQDVLAASGSQPLAPLVPHLANGRAVGLHVLTTRRVSGASRGLYEPFTLGVREAGCLSLIMSGDRTEGQLIAGVRASTMPVGRAKFVRTGTAPRIVQTAYLAPEDPTPEVP